MFLPTTKILIVDDMSTMRKLVKRSLIGLGFSIFEEAEDGFKAWDKFVQVPDIGLVVSDWNMPNCTGIDFLRRVRADARGKTLPFLLLTAEGEEVQIREAIAAGVDSYVLKPFTFDSLKMKIEQVHKKRGGAAAA